MEERNQSRSHNKIYEKKSKKDQESDRKRKIIIIICLAVAAVCLIALAVFWGKRIKNQKNLKDVQEIAQVEDENTKIDFEALQKVNSDIYAWIYIPGTKVNYPILQSGDDKEEDYYLDHNLDGSEGLPGCIYTQKRNSIDFSDPNTVVYGHNMKDGSMFKGLHDFQDAAFFQENQYIYIYTPQENYIYRIFAAYRYDNRLILEYYNDFRDQQTFAVYLEEILSQQNSVCNLNKDVEVTSEDKIITLSTCIGNSDYRYLVQGKLLSGKESEELNQEMDAEQEKVEGVVNETITDAQKKEDSKEE